MITTVSGTDTLGVSWHERLVITGKGQTRRRGQPRAGARRTWWPVSQASH